MSRSQVAGDCHVNPISLLTVSSVLGSTSSKSSDEESSGRIDDDRPLKMATRRWMPTHNYLTARSEALHAEEVYLARNDLICSGSTNVSGMSGLSTSAPHLQLIILCHRLFTQPTSAPDLI